MALQKDNLIPGHNTIYNYMRIDGFSKCHQHTRDAEFHVSIHKDAASAALPDAVGHPVCRGVRFTTVAFDNWFSKAALKASGKDQYSQAYAALKALTAAWVKQIADEAANAAWVSAVQAYNNALAVYNISDVKPPLPIPPVKPTPSIVVGSDDFWLINTAFFSGIYVGGTAFVGAVDV